MSGTVHCRQALRGFSMVELLVTIVLAGIAFAALLPLFVNVLGTTSRDARRNDAQLIAQDRIEQVRLLNYAYISDSNLNSPPSPSTFGDGRFGASYTLTNQRPYAIQYTVIPQNNSQKVRVRVTAAGAGASVTMETIVKDPAPGVVSVDQGGGSSGPLPTTNLSITASFKNWQQVLTANGGNGVTYKRVLTATGASLTSARLYPVATGANPYKVVFTGLTGGSEYTYTVTCYSQYGTFTSPPFHLLKSARLKFDTHPGGS
jgi:prepilin-type N-terminal cleavage/methylation domain-containing protein